MKAALPLAAALLLSACVGETTGPAAAVPAAQAWRSIATLSDRERVRKWRDSWVKGLRQARTAGHGEEIGREGVLLQPDSALKGAAPSAGDYRCRTIKVGGQGEGSLSYVAYPAFDCRIGAETGGVRDFVKLTGSQRPIGRLFADSDRRLIFLGTMQLGDERGTLRYGHDRERDMVGLLERIGERRWRLVFPWPAFESTVDVLELLPKEQG